MPGRSVRNPSSISPMAELELTNLLPKDETRPDLATGVGRLVVGLVDTLRLALEAQAIRRFEAGTLTEEQEEALGDALAALSARMPELRRLFDLPEDEEARLSLGQVEGVDLDLADALDQLVETGLVVNGDALVTLANVALIELDLSVHLRAAR